MTVKELYQQCQVMTVKELYQQCQVMSVEEQCQVMTVAELYQQCQVMTMKELYQQCQVMSVEEQCQVMTVEELYQQCQVMTVEQQCQIMTVGQLYQQCQVMTVEELYQQCQVMSTSRQRATRRQFVSPSVRLTRLKSMYLSRRQLHSAPAGSISNLSQPRPSVVAPSTPRCFAEVDRQVPDDARLHARHIPEVVVFKWNEEDEDVTLRESNVDAKVAHFIIRVLGLCLLTAVVVQVEHSVGCLFDCVCQLSRQ